MNNGDADASNMKGGAAAFLTHWTMPLLTRTFFQQQLLATTGVSCNYDHSAHPEVQQQGAKCIGLQGISACVKMDLKRRIHSKLQGTSGRSGLREITVKALTVSPYLMLSA